MEPGVFEELGRREVRQVMAVCPRPSLRSSVSCGGGGTHGATKLRSKLQCVCMGTLLSWGWGLGDGV